MFQQMLTIVSSLLFVVPICDKTTIALSSYSAIAHVVYKVSAL